MKGFEFPQILDIPELPEIPDLPTIPDVANIPIVPTETFELAQELQNTFAKFNFANVFTQINNSFSNTAYQLIQSIGNAIQEKWSSTFHQLAEQTARLVEAVTKFQLPTLTDEEAEQLVESNRIWGQYGWTYVPAMPISMFDTPPADLAEANKLAMKYCTDKEMENVFTDLRKWKLNHKDLDSAIFCYQNRQYKACALLLCGMIESKMIRLRGDKGRPVGSGAVNELKRQYNDSGEKILAEAMFVCNLLAYLERLFSRTDGFKNEPETLNRNYIGHGMNRRMVRKRDCIQLFLAFNNLMQFFDLDLLKS